MPFQPDLRDNGRTDIERCAIQSILPYLQGMFMTFDSILGLDKQLILEILRVEDQLHQERQELPSRLYSMSPLTLEVVANRVVNSEQTEGEHASLTLIANFSSAQLNALWAIILVGRGHIHPDALAKKRESLSLASYQHADILDALRGQNVHKALREFRYLRRLRRRVS